MKKILIVTSGLTHGGVNKTLLSLLKNADHSIYDIEVFPIYQSGPYRFFFSDYSVVTMEKIIPDFLYYNISDENNFLADFYIKLMIHLMPVLFCKKVGDVLSGKNYDIVISFQEGFTTYLSTFIRAPKHIAWIHCDYSRYLDNSSKSEEKVYEKYDKIVAVSEYTADVVKSYIPSLADRVVAIHNVMDNEGIVSLSKEEIEDSRFVPDNFTLISIGRMDPVKRFSYIPAMAHELKNKNISFRWYIIGDGGLEKKKVIQKIKKYNVDQNVILLGSKNNPYPYIRQASILICPSISEACPNVINEAKILHVPVVSADFPSARELIETGRNGYICSINNIPHLLEKIYFNPEIYDSLSSNVKNYRYENDIIMQRIYDILAC